MTPVPTPTVFKDADDDHVAGMVSELEIDAESDDGSNLDELDDMYLSRVYNIEKASAVDDAYDPKSMEEDGQI